MEKNIDTQQLFRKYLFIAFMIFVPFLGAGMMLIDIPFGALGRSRGGGLIFFLGLVFFFSGPACVFIGSLGMAAQIWKKWKSNRNKQQKLNP